MMSERVFRFTFFKTKVFLWDFRPLNGVEFEIAAVENLAECLDDSSSKCSRERIIENFSVFLYTRFKVPKNFFVLCLKGLNASIVEMFLSILQSLVIIMIYYFRNHKVWIDRLTDLFSCFRSLETNSFHFHSSVVIYRHVDTNKFLGMLVAVSILLQLLQKVWWFEILRHGIVHARDDFVDWLFPRLLSVLARLDRAEEFSQRLLDDKPEVRRHLEWWKSLKFVTI